MYFVDFPEMRYDCLFREMAFLRFEKSFFKFEKWRKRKLPEAMIFYV